jgi:hypothetical protein
MGLVDVITLVEDQLTLTLRGLNLAVPLFRFGEKDLVLEDAPPRITWVPRQGPVGAPDKLGGGTNASQLGDGATTPGPLWARALGVDCHIWGAAPPVPNGGDQQRADIGACEVIGRHLVTALHAQLYGSYKITSERWDTSAVSNLGVRWILSIVVGMPFVREADTLSLPIIDFPETPVIQH